MERPGQERSRRRRVAVLAAIALAAALVGAILGIRCATCTPDDESGGGPVARGTTISVGSARPRRRAVQPDATGGGITPRPLESVVAVRVTLRGGAVGDAVVTLCDGAKESDPGIVNLPPTASGRTAADGTVRLRVAAAWAVVRADDGHGRVAARSVAVPRGLAEFPVSVELPGGTVRVRARCVTKNGRPWHGSVAIRRERGGGGAWSRTRDDGRVEFAGLDDTDGRLFGRAATCGPADPEVSGPAAVEGASGEVVWVIDDGLRTVTGRVTALESGEPVADARIARVTWASEDPAVAKTAPDGTYRIDVSGATTLRATAPGFASAAVPLTADDSVADFALVPGCVVRGRVVASDGDAPAAGAIVFVEARDSGGSPFRMKAAADGTFELRDLPAMECRVRVLAGGWHADWRAGGEVTGTTSPDHPLDVVIRAKRAARLVGRVVGPDGRPVGGAIVSVSERECEWYGAEGLRTRPVTDADGRYAFDDCVPSDGVEERVEVAAEGLPWWSGRCAPLREGETTTCDIELGAGRELVVEVTAAADGAPVAGALVVTDLPGSDRPRRHTNARGIARFSGVGPRAVSATIESPAYGVTCAFEDDPPSAEPLRVRLEASRQVSGVVLYGDGSPAAGVGVRLRPRDQDPYLSLGATTGPDGRFRIDRAGAGPWIVVANVDCEWIYVNWTPGTEVTLHAKAVATARAPDVALIVRATGPDARALVRFRAVHGWPSLDETRAQIATHGAATLRIPPRSSTVRSFGADGQEIPPTVAVSVWDARDAAGRALPCGPATLLVPWPLPAEVTVALTRGVVVEGRVLGSDRRPRAGVRVVAAVDESGQIDGGDGLRALAVTDSAADGTFRFDTLPAGSLVLLAIDPGRRHIARVATVSDTSGVELVIAE